MSRAYCQCCQRVTSHKVVLQRCVGEDHSLVQRFFHSIAMLLHGDHYVKMEERMICRECNTPAAAKAVALTDAHTHSA